MTQQHVEKLQEWRMRILHNQHIVDDLGIALSFLDAEINAFEAAKKQKSAGCRRQISSKLFSLNNPIIALFSSLSKV